MEIKLNGIEVQLEPCGHCKMTPSEADAARAIKQAKEAYQRPCPACGLALEIRSISMTHQLGVKDGELVWRLISVELWNVLGIEVQGNKRYWIHEACCERIFRGRLERGEGWRPWSDDSHFTVTQ